MGRVVVVGSSNTDLITLGSSLPKPGQTLIHDRFVRAAGGKGANQAVAASRAGAKVSLVAALGADSFGQAALAGFKKDRINIRFIKIRKETASGIALILVDRKGENMITVAPGANATLKPSDVRAASGEIRNADVVLGCLEVPWPTVTEALRLAKKAGKRTILNPAPAPTKALPRNLLTLADILTPNEHEAKVLGRPRAGQIWIITRGAKGVELVQAGRKTLYPAFKVKPLDTVGAGDAFNGALATALSEGQDLDSAIRFAQAAAAIAVTRLGAQPGMPRRAEIQKLLGSGF